MNLKQLEAFARVAETKSFSAAAKMLFLTQPTVSAHIASLERELNTCLLIRNTKGVALSESGKELYAYAEQMLELEQKIRERFGLTGRQPGSVLRIAASTIPSLYLLPDIMARFRKEYPEEQLKLFETDSSGVVEMILSHKADVGFTGTVLEKGSCTYIPFYQDELVVLTPSSERYRARKNDDIVSWILEEPVILREEGSGTRKEALRLLVQTGVDISKLNVAAMMENQETIKRSVGSGMGISILSKLAAKEEIDSGKLLAFPLGETGGKRNINVVYDAGYPSLPAADKFIKTVKQMYL
ncbi:MAG TPA: LysR family transcriptional regulator [Candidatus Mediterraneibacter gallistercoris]|uniref:LysR family transcriptional regulator n=1 Tax=Candidatus Mediterraneibacter gallistercoris TaxID=2838671 RepID=A0A9D2P6P3_9FIRM|nr:LysR family transcriptional regulator [Candidatus Mediterraneibacter gallistercoris]